MAPKKKNMNVKKGLLKNALSKGEKAAASSSKGPLSKGKKAAASSNKATLSKGKKRTLPKGQKAKGKKATLSKGKLTRKNLKNLGKLSLEEKVEKIAEQTDTADEAALVLKQNIDQNERGRIWAKHQAALKHGPEAEQQHQVANKTQKGLSSLLWFIQECQVPQCQGYLWNN